jgi:hypothetical protein
MPLDLLFNRGDLGEHVSDAFLIGSSGSNSSSASGE